MSMRLYKVSGQWYTWDYLHNELGYTESASTTTAYKSSDSDTWGQSVVDSGYRTAEDSSDLETYEFWIDNVSGWFSASEMAQEGYYPSFATDGPRFVKESELSVSVEISGTGWRDSWYLLKKDVAIGWCTVRELEENGWEPDQGEIVGGLISDTYDKRIYSFGNGGLLVPGAYAYSDGNLLDMQWDFGGTVEEYVVPSQPAIGGVMTATTDSKFYGDIFGVLELDVVSLPTVTLISTGYGIQGQSATASVNPNASTTSLRIWYNGGFNGDNLSRDANYAYALYKYSNGSSQKNPCGTFVVDWSNDLLCVKNITPNSAPFYSAKVATCDSADTTVITVYSTSNEAFNAFKFNLDGVDYYYVLDETQTDWTDDLSSIGYILVQQIDLILALRYSPPSGPFLSKTFSANDWWWSGIISQQEADSITAAGIGVITQADSSKWYCGPYGGLNYNPEFDYELLALYSDMGETPVTFNSSNFYLGANDYSNYPSYPGALFIHAINAFNTSTMTYKIRATRGGNRNNVIYLSQDRSNVTLSYNLWMPLYRRDGVVIEYTGTLPTIIGYFSDPDTYTMNSTSSGAYEFRNNNGTLEVRYLWPPGITVNRIVVQWT